MAIGLLVQACAGRQPSPPQQGKDLSEATVAELVRELDAPEGWRRQFVIAKIAEGGPAGAPAASAKLLEIVERGAWDDRPSAAAALGWLQVRDAVPALVRALDAPDWRLAFAACRGLERLGTAAAPARARLSEVADKHWMPTVRGAAAAAVLAADGTPDPPSELADDFGLSHPFKHQCRRVSGGPDWHGAWEGDALLERKVPGGKLHGVDRGEWGGEVTFSRWWGWSSDVLADVNPLAFTTLGSALVLIEGLAHLTISRGKVWRLERGDDGWRARPIVELPGSPIAFRSTAGGGLEIESADGTMVVSATGDVESVSCLDR